jgi:transcriptional regulator
MSSAGRSHVELFQGTLDLVVLQALATMGPQHAYALASRLEQVSDHPFILKQGTLYPALVRLEQQGWIKGTWGRTDNGRDAKFYAMTKRGTRALVERAERWRKVSALIDKLRSGEA